MRIGLLTILAVAGCAPNVGSAGMGFDGGEALAWATWQVGLGPRIPGTQAHSEAADGMVQRLEELDWSVERQRFAYLGTELQNLVARQDEVVEGVVILGAHYDTRPRADRDASDPGQPVPGANDGASGAALLMEMARVLSLRDSGRSVWLVFFDAEDSGSIAGWDWVVGSRQFVATLTIDPAIAVIVDMVGDADLQLYWERNSDPTITTEIWQTAARLGHPAFIPELRHSLLDDHTPFLQAGIPAVDIIDFDYPYWHTTEDTLDKISAASLEQVGATLLAWLEAGG